MKQPTALLKPLIRPEVLCFIREEHNRRLGIFDSIRGILMVLVIFFHLLYVYYGEEPYHTASALIPCFTMEAFLYAAGLFSQDDYAKSDHVLGRLLLLCALAAKRFL